MNRRILNRLAVLAAVVLPITALAQTTESAPPREVGAAPTANAPEPCSHSPHCAWGKNRSGMVHEQHTQDLPLTFAYPYTLPEGLTGGVTAVAINSKQHLFAFQRNKPGQPQLFEFDQNRKLVRTIGEDVIGHQIKAHGLAIDPEDNIWICDETGAVVRKLSPEGKLLLTIGVNGERGDWDEAAGQRLLWEPLTFAFGASGDVYIGMGHSNESPNDTDRSPSNKIGAARILHLDKNGKFINQWFGNSPGQGHFSMVHGLAVNPNNGNVYIGDREEYRIVVYDRNGKFVKTIQMRNLVCALYVDPHKQLWLATGQDGQVFKIDWDGNVLGAIGNGPGRGEGQFFESTYMAMDSHGNLFVGDTATPRITELAVK